MKIHPPYKHLVQKAQLCHAACVQMALFRRGHWFEQEQLAKELGIRINAENAHLFTTKLTIGSPIGIRVDELPNKLNKFFTKHKLKLSAQGYAHGEFDDAAQLIRENIKVGNDVLLVFHWAPFKKESKHGHWVLSSAIQNSTVTVCDPSPNQPTHWSAPVEQFVEGMKTRGKYPRGIVIIKPNHDQ